MADTEFRRRVLADAHGILAWNKPPGLCSTGRTLDDPDCAQHRAMQYADGMVWALHQLDKDTSGVVLFARKKNLVAPWQRRWNTPAVQKYYAALVHGRLPRTQTTVDAPLRRMERRGHTRMTVDDQGKPALTELWELSHSKHYSLVLARPRTGRTHQVRVHLQHIGCPLIGEERYNSIPCGYHNRHALHALAIITDQRPPLHHIEAPLADDLHRPAHRLHLDLSPLGDWRQAVSDC